mmetsp:Transcript_31901/g.28256  ORF Transcript_31901/g.28256 Transcript_31901/m.28256 type:complete len:173 (+) Transcript_31901:24-542(+)
MFLMVNLQRIIRLEPRDLDPELDKIISTKLSRMMKGTCSGENGYIIDIIDVTDIGDGLILDTNGEVEFPVKYTALIFKPRKGDVMDGVVSNINMNSIVVTVGPQKVMIAHSSMPNNIEYDQYTKVYKTPDMNLMIKEDDEIRFRIIGVNILASEITCAGTIDEPYLGPINQS